MANFVEPEGFISDKSIHLNSASRWFIANNLSIKDNTTQELLICSKEHHFYNPEYVKFLCLYVDPDLKWDQHVSFLSTKLCRAMYMLRGLSDNTKSVHLSVFTDAPYK